MRRVWDAIILHVRSRPCNIEIACVSRNAALPMHTDFRCHGITTSELTNAQSTAGKVLQI